MSTTMCCVCGTQECAEEPYTFYEKWTEKGPEYYTTVRDLCCGCAMVDRDHV